MEERQLGLKTLMEVGRRKRAFQAVAQRDLGNAAIKKILQVGETFLFLLFSPQCVRIAGCSEELLQFSLRV